MYTTIILLHKNFMSSKFTQTQASMVAFPPQMRPSVAISPNTATLKGTETKPHISHRLVRSKRYSNGAAGSSSVQIGVAWRPADRNNCHSPLLPRELDRCGIFRLYESVPTPNLAGPSDLVAPVEARLSRNGTFTPPDSGPRAIFHFFFMEV